MGLKLKDILKSDNLVFSRESIATAVRNKAQKVAARKGVSIEKAELRIWKKYPELQLAYDNAPAPILKREPRMAMVTEAEATLDQRARRRMAKFNENYATACKRVLEDDPGLYTKYEKEMAAGSTFETPEYVNGNGGNGDEPDEDDDEDGDQNTMYARRPQSTTTNSMVDQQRKGRKRR